MPRTFPTHALAAIALAVAAACAVAPAAAAGQRPTVPLAATHADEFEGVSCTTAKGCLAVGSRFDSTTDELLALGETRNPGSSTWAVHDPAPISGATTTGFGPIGNGETVSCVSSPSAMCMGIGSYNNSAEHQLNYAATWDWSSWKVVNPPNPSPTLSSGLDAVRCVSSKFCLTIGHWIDSATGKDALESEVWNGKSWAMTKKMPLVPAKATSGVRLWGLSCVSTKFCSAVGDSLNSKLAFVSLGETWNGKSWKIQPTPAGKQKGLSELFDVSCLSAKFCLSTGSLAAEWNGKSWSSKAFPVPSPKDITNAVSLSCLSVKDCTAAGGYSSTAGTFTMAWTWNGKSLSLQPAQNP
jgi:hypothetical protein